jgi:hypothetical protein
MAWDEPYKASRKIHRHFDERLAPLIDPAIPPVVRWVWEYEGSGKPDGVAPLLVGCQQVIDALEILVANPAPGGWQRHCRSPSRSVGSGCQNLSGHS